MLFALNHYGKKKEKKKHESYFRLVNRDGESNLSEHKKVICILQNTAENSVRKGVKLVSRSCVFGTTVGQSAGRNHRFTCLQGHNKDLLKIFLK